MKCEGSGGESPGIWPLLCSTRITSMHKMLVENYRYNVNNSVRQMHFQQQTLACAFFQNDRKYIFDCKNVKRHSDTDNQELTVPFLTAVASIAALEKEAITHGSIFAFSWFHSRNVVSYFCTFSCKNRIYSITCIRKDGTKESCVNQLRKITSIKQETY